MADGTKIEWTNATWNPITGCTLVSEGCRNCYAAELAVGRLQHHPSRAGLARRNAEGQAKFTGEVRFNEGWLDQPLRWTKPRRIFVCAHGDLFHEDVPDAWIDRVFAVMALSPQHVFQVLTKRPERMRDYFEPYSQRRADGLSNAVLELGYTGPLEALQWALPNVWLGVSVEDQATADARIPLLLDTPAAKRWISAEPLLGPVDFSPKADATYQFLSEWYGDEGFDPTGSQPRQLRRAGYFPRVDWVVVGGESGRGARPMHPDWARDLRDQCAAAEVPFFFKQWGAWLPEGQRDAQNRERDAVWFADDCNEDELYLFVDGVDAMHLGKKAAGHLLDGVEHREFPA
tara:strand:- start:8141 stop:9175 length:1035 start_codon:yes stop_codon:yes gene_type:complete